MKSLAALWIVMGIFLAGCSQEIIFPTPLPTSTPAPTATPLPTPTPIEFPDWPTPYPTPTPFTIVFPTPFPTSTPAPTATPQPTATPFELPMPEPTTAAAPRVSPTFTPIPKPTPFFIDLLDPPIPSVSIREHGSSSTVNWNASTGSLEYQIQGREASHHSMWSWLRTGCLRHRRCLAELEKCQVLYQEHRLLFAQIRQIES